MGTRIKTQRRGKGSPTFKAKQKGKKSKYISPEKKGKMKAQVIDFIKDTGRSAPLAKIVAEGKKEFFTVAAEGMYLGEEIEIGQDAELKIGNIIPLSNVPEGCPIFNIELTPGDGGKMAKSTGNYSLLVSKSGKKATIRLPSGKNKKLSLQCRAIIGNAAGGERTEKPFIKAGSKYYHMKAKSRPWHKTRGVAMNAVAHPHGGEQHHVGKSKSVSRHAPPGRKVGQISSKRTGKKKKK